MEKALRKELYSYRKTDYRINEWTDIDQWLSNGEQRNIVAVCQAWREALSRRMIMEIKYAN